MFTTLAVSGYRSLGDLVVPLDRLNLVTGPNGSGKSNLYRALRLLAAARAQSLIVSHAPALIDALQQLPECHSITLEKKFGETVIVGQQQPAVSWQWPAR